MRKLQQHWRLTVGVTALLILAGSFLWIGTKRPVAMAFQQTDLDPLTRHEHDAIRNVLADISLDRDALMALNPTAEQAESLLSTARGWWFDNQVTLATLEADITAKRTIVRQYRKALATGTAQPGDEEALKLAVSDLAGARRAYRNGMASLETSVNALLSASQKTTWTAIKTGWGQAFPLRMLGLSDEQRIDLSRAHRRYRYSHAAATSSAERASAVSAWNTERSQILTTPQQDMLDAYDGYYTVASSAAADAINTVLAVEQG